MGEERQEGHVELVVKASQAPRLSVIVAQTTDGVEVIGIVMTEYENRKDGIWVELQDHSVTHVRRDDVVVVLCTPYSLARSWLDGNLSSPIFSKLILPERGGENDADDND